MDNYIKSMFGRIFKLFQDRYAHKSIILAVDSIASIVASVMSFAIVSWALKIDMNPNIYLYLTLFSAVSSVISIVSFRTYAVAIRHTTIVEVGALIGVTIFKAAIMLVFLFALSSSGTYKTPFLNLFLVEILDVLFTLIFLIIIRTLVSTIYKMMLKKVSEDKVQRILVYGDNDAAVSAGMMVIKSRDYIFEGYIVINQAGSFSKRTLSGYPVYTIHTERKFQEIVDKHNISGVVFANYDDARKEQDRLISYCAKNDISVLISPGVSELGDSSVIMPPLREVKIEDLLGREQVEINMDEIRTFLTDKVVMVTGAAGSIGSELCRQLLRIPIQKLILFDIAETPMNDVMLELKDVSPRIEKKFVIGDVRQRPKLEYVFKRYQPNVVFHAAAYKHVPMMENNPVEAVNTNVFGTMNVANMSLEFGVEKFVMVSTDKAVNPANVMGASKRIAEIYTQSLSKAIAEGVVKGKTKYVTTRFGNVLGSNGSVIPLFKKQIAAGGPVTVTDPRIIRYFMTIPEACRLVLEAATMGKEDEIFVFDMGEPVKIADLAKNMITLAGLELGKDINIEYVGLRPGEKLYEELLSNEENTIPTVHKKIFLAKVRRYNYEDVKANFEKLKEAAVTMDKEATVAQMKEIVPEFKSCNSRYGRLDK
ncbi:MAG: polysaccharide biosynthesis protein [Bacteroidales bacterium]|nr:polysaccharide biosynthesis protein [Bacteroidales bacterium]